MALPPACCRLYCMEDMALPWFKFWSSDYLSDPKTRNFSSQQHSCWIHLLCFAANSTSPGIIKFLTEESLMQYSGVNPMENEWDTTKGVLKLFEERGMIEQSNGIITICNWSNRQDTALTNAERQARFRMRNNSVTEVTNSNETSNAKVTLDKIRVDKIRVENTLITKVMKDEYSKDFLEFWDKYPRKVGKGGAWLKWKRSKLPNLSLLLEAIEKQKISPQWQRDGGQYIPHPSTWLTQRRWQDDISVDKPINSYG